MSTENTVSGLRKWASIEVDDDRRAKLVGAAQLNEVLAQTLESVVRVAQG